MKRYSTFAILFFSLCLFGQHDFSDSLDILKNQPEKFSVLKEKVEELKKTNPAEALKLAVIHYDWATAENRPLEQAKALAGKGDAFYHLDSLQKSSLAYLESAQILENLTKTDTALLANVYHNAGANYYDLGVSDLAENYLIKSIPYAKKMPDREVLVANYANLANLFFQTGNYEKALIYNDSCLQIDRSLKDTLSIASDLRLTGIINIRFGNHTEGIGYLKEALDLTDAQKYPEQYCRALNTLGIGYMDIWDYENSLKYFTEALDLSKQLKDTIMTARRLINLGELKMKYDKLDAAEGHLLESLSLVRDPLYFREQLVLNRILGDLYRRKKAFSKSEFYNKEALKIAERYQLNTRMRAVYRNLMELNREKGDFKKALDYALKFHAVSDTIHSSEAQKRAANLNIQYQTEKREAEITALKLRNELKEKDIQTLQLHRKWFALALILSLLLAAAIFYANRQRQQRLIREKEIKIEKQLDEIESLRQKIARMIEEKQPVNTLENVSLKTINHLALSPLTEREFDILKCIISGKSNQEIADDLFLSVNTVKFHLKNIYGKLEVKNRIQAVRILLEKEVPVV